MGEVMQIRWCKKNEKKICVKNIKEDVLERAKITREMGVLKLFLN